MYGVVFVVGMFFAALLIYALVYGFCFAVSPYGWPVTRKFIAQLAVRMEVYFLQQWKAFKTTKFYAWCYQMYQRFCNRLRSWYQKVMQSPTGEYLLKPLKRTFKVSYQLNVLLIRIQPKVAKMLPILVVLSSVLLYAQGRLFARFIGSLYHGTGMLIAFNVFCLFVVIGLWVKLLIKKLVTSERFHVREYFDPIVPCARVLLGIKSFQAPHKDELAKADEGIYFVKFFAPQQVAFMTQAMNVLLGVMFLAFYAPILLPLLFIPLAYLIARDLHLAAKAARLEEDAFYMFAECTESKYCFTYPDRFKGTELFGMSDALINDIKVRSAKAFDNLRRNNWDAFGTESKLVLGLGFLLYAVIYAALQIDAPPEIRIFLVTTVISLAAASKMLAETFAEQLMGSEKVEKALDYEKKDREEKAKAAGQIIVKDQYSPENAEALESLGAGDIEFRNFSFAYSRGKNIIEDASVVIPAGSKVWVLGPNGCGKTTAFAVFSGLYEPQPQTLFFGGLDLATIHPKIRMRKFRQLTQDVVAFRHPFDQTLGWAAGFINAEECPEEEKWHALKMACLDGKIMNAPLGLYTSLMSSKVRKQSEKQAVEFSLSGGEMKRLNHAMFYIGLKFGAAKAAILDEPYNNIDPPIAEMLRANLDEIPGTVLVSTHDARHYLRQDDLVLFVQKRDHSGGHPRSRFVLDMHGALLGIADYRNYLAIDKDKAA